MLNILLIDRVQRSPQSQLGLDKAKFEQNLSKMGSLKKQVILQAKWAANFVNGLSVKMRLM